MPIRIDRCVCTDRTFADLLQQADRERLSLDELMFETRAGLGCTLCRPYLREAMKTGQKVFTRVLTDERDAGA